MKMRLYKIGDTYHLYSKERGMQRVPRIEARHFLLSFSDEKFRTRPICTIDDPEIESYASCLIAELLDNNELLIKNAELFRILADNAEVNLLSTKEYGKLYGKQPAVIRRYCQNKRIVEAIKTPGGYIIPEDAPYPNV